jgi:hypothetical protein
MTLNTPVLLLTYKRPDTTQTVFNAIQEARPTKLYVSQNFPSSQDEAEQQKWEKTREIVDQVDWDCEVKTLFRKQHLSLKESISSAIDWFFDREEIGIILEDDCVPNRSFFEFSEELLNYYRTDERIMSISGDNFQFGHNSSEASYYFSRYNHIWGWASWRRAWEKYDVQMKLWPKVKNEGVLYDMLIDTNVVKYWENVFDRTYLGHIDTWDYQWTFACWINNGLTILPSVNLISNIGFREDATNTQKKNKYANLPTEPVRFPLNHPLTIIRNARADRITEADHYGISRSKLREIFSLLFST